MMAHYYGDSSALVKRHIPEIGTAWLRVLLERHPLRSHDAIQLSSALMANETLLAAGLPGLVFLCADEKLAGTAQLEGLAAENPNAHP